MIECGENLISTGVSGLDHILFGGLAPNQVYLIEGAPGTRKTTLALQFLLAGARDGQSGLYITLSESADELKATAASHGWDESVLEIFELSPVQSELCPENQYTVYHAEEVELGETNRALIERIHKSTADRIVIDSVAELRLLAADPRRYRRQILALKQHLTSEKFTVLLLDDRTSHVDERQLHSIVHGVITLERLPREYGRSRRRLEISKFRGKDYQDGYHDYRIETGGMKVYPRLAEDDGRTRKSPSGMVSSGNAALDEMLGGGLARGSGTLLVGPSGSGKTTLALRYATASLERGEPVAFYTFDEGLASLIARAECLGMDLQKHLNAGRLALEQIDPAELSPGEFADRVRASVQGNVSARMVIIDSLNGYMTSMPEERFLSLQMHELLTYLNRHEVVTLFVLAQQGIFGSMNTALDVSYLADTMLLLRFFESEGNVRRALSVVKKRSGSHDQLIRELHIGGGQAVEVGPPLTGFRGVLTGTPQFVGSEKRLFADE